MFVGNSETPFETIHAQEGDIVKIHMFNELQLPWAIHWYEVSPLPHSMPKH